MKAPAPLLITALAVPGLAALGGALAVYSEYDDSPGGFLIGLLMIVVAVALGWRAVGRTG